VARREGEGIKIFFFPSQTILIYTFLCNSSLKGLVVQLLPDTFTVVAQKKLLLIA